jgi:hypothetical protein
VAGCSIGAGASLPLLRMMGDPGQVPICGPGEDLCRPLTGCARLAEIHVRHAFPEVGMYRNDDAMRNHALGSSSAGFSTEWIPPFYFCTVIVLLAFLGFRRGAKAFMGSHFAGKCGGQEESEPCGFAEAITSRGNVRELEPGVSLLFQCHPHRVPRCAHLGYGRRVTGRTLHGASRAQPSPPAQSKSTPTSVASHSGKTRVCDISMPIGETRAGVSR